MIDTSLGWLVRELLEGIIFTPSPSAARLAGDPSAALVKDLEFARFKKSNIWVFGSKRKRKMISLFCRGLVLRLLAFVGCALFKTVHSASFQTFDVFYPKWQNITSLQRHISQKCLTDLFRNFNIRRHIDAGYGTY